MKGQRLDIECKLHYLIQYQSDDLPLPIKKLRKKSSDICGGNGILVTRHLYLIKKAGNIQQLLECAHLFEVKWKRKAYQKLGSNAMQKWYHSFLISYPKPPKVKL